MRQLSPAIRGLTLTFTALLLLGAVALAHGPLIPPPIPIPGDGTGTPNPFQPVGGTTPGTNPVAPPPAGGNTPPTVPPAGGDTPPAPPTFPGGGGPGGIGIPGESTPDVTVDPPADPSPPTPEPSGGSTPGVTVTGRAPGGSGGGAPAPRPYRPLKKKGRSLEGSTDWATWWRLNREPYLDVKAALREAAPVTQSSSITLGDGGVEKERNRSAERLRVHIVPFLRRSLSDPHHAVRARAVLALGKVGAPASAKDIFPSLKDGHRNVREAAVLALGVLGGDDVQSPLAAIAADAPAGRKLVGRRRAVPSELRALATLALGLASAGDTTGRSVEVLVRLLDGNERNAQINVAAAVGLGFSGDRTATPALLGALRDKGRDAYVRANAAGALGRLGDLTARRDLILGLADNQTQVRRACACALGVVATEADAEVVNALLRTARRGSDRSLRNFALIALGRVGGEKARRFLRTQVKGGDALERTFAAIALGLDAKHHEDAPRSATTKLIRQVLAKTSSRSERGAYVIALGLSGDADVVPEIVAILDRPGPEDVRAQAALALGMLRAKSALRSLRAAVREKGSPGLAGDAATALGLIGDPEAIKILEEVVATDANSALRGAALRGLGLLGNKRVALDLGRVLMEDGIGSKPHAAAALGILGDKDDVPVLQTIFENVDYTSHRGLSNRLIRHL